MHTVNSTDDLRHHINQWRQAGERIAFVPTMGDLHQGHLSLVEAAKQHADRVVVSIFVNPLQFGENEDFGSYARVLESDTHKLESVDVDLLFSPSVTEVYPNGSSEVAQISVPKISEVLCGAARPGHFDGVATVVGKLFNMVQPDVALFGEKDCQQLMVIRKLVADLCFPIKIIGVETYREIDGLAKSSRNRYLTLEQRDHAPALYRELCKAKALLESKVIKLEDFKPLMEESMDRLIQSGFIPDYFEIRCANDLTEPTTCNGDLIILAAAWLGKARLIDNIRISRGES